MSDSESDALPLGYTPINMSYYTQKPPICKGDFKMRTRFAPSPTGYMHIGNLRTALYCYLIAKHYNGDFILRIEDTDQQREVDGAIDLIYEVLDETGLHYDEGPDKDMGHGPYIQSQRLEIYHDYAKKLIHLKGAHYCFCQGEIEGEDPCKHLSASQIAERLANKEPYVIRQTIPNDGITTFDDEVYGHIEVENKDLNEGILIKSDGFPTYNFANVIDDHLMEISHVIRGNEYLTSTPKYNLIYNAFDWQIPTYIHLPPVNKDETHKLSKRNGDASYQDLKKQGYLTETIINYIALLGWAPRNEEVLSLDELIEQFDIDRISKSPAIFDINKLKWMNGEYLRRMSLEEFHQVVLPYYKHITRDVDLLELSKVLQPRVERLIDIEDMTDFINEALPFDAGIYTHKKMKTNPENSLEALELVFEALKDYDDFTNDDAMCDFLVSLAKEHGLKNGRIMWPMRVALSNKSLTPGGCIELAHILGKEETMKRLQQAINDLKG